MSAREFICEVCGKKLVATPDEAFNLGWDTAPRFTSHTTCETCPITGTMWWMLIQEQQNRK